MSRQMKLSFLPRALVPQVPCQGAEVVLAVDKVEGVIHPPQNPVIAGTENKERRGFTADAKLEVLKSDHQMGP